MRLYVHDFKNDYQRTPCVSAIINRSGMYTGRRNRKVPVKTVVDSEHNGDHHFVAEYMCGQALCNSGIVTDFVHRWVENSASLNFPKSEQKAAVTSLISKLTSVSSQDGGLQRRFVDPDMLFEQAYRDASRTSLTSRVDSAPTKRTKHTPTNDAVSYQAFRVYQMWSKSTLKLLQERRTEVWLEHVLRCVIACALKARLPPNVPAIEFDDWGMVEFPEPIVEKAEVSTLVEDSRVANATAETVTRVLRSLQKTGSTGYAYFAVMDAIDVWEKHAHVDEKMAEEMKRSFQQVMETYEGHVRVLLKDCAFHNTTCPKELIRRIGECVDVFNIAEFIEESYFGWSSDIFVGFLHHDRTPQYKRLEKYFSLRRLYPTKRIAKMMICDGLSKEDAQAFLRYNLTDANKTERKHMWRFLELFKAAPTST